MTLAEFINKVFELKGDLNSFIYVIDREGDTISIKDLEIEIDCGKDIIINGLWK